jgi:GWxTD domain-containing protein
MSARPVLVALIGTLFLAPALRADKLDKEAKAWLDQVAPIMTADEEKAYKDLKDKDDRLEFQKIFWARRDPDLDTPENEFQTEYEKSRTAADLKFKVGGRSGSQSDCGRTFILLGEPNDTKKKPVGETTGPRGSGETWTYKDRPGVSFKGGQIEIALDGDCRFPEGSGFGAQLDRVAEDKIAHPNIDYRKGKDGRVVKLADQLPKPTPSRALLKEPRQDFPLAAQVAYVKVQDGGTMLMGMVRGDTAGLKVDEAGGKKTAKLTVSAEVTGEDGKAVASTEQLVTATVADGSFLAAFRVALKPGKYTLKAGVLDAASKGSVASLPIEVPDLNKGELSMATLLLVRDVEEGPAVADNALEAFRMAPNARFVPGFGGQFKKSDSISFFYQYYDAQPDPATSKPSSTVTIQMFKDGKAASAPATQDWDTPVAGQLIGPIQLASFGAGQYKVTVKVKDKVANKDLAQEATFQVAEDKK